MRMKAKLVAFLTLSLVAITIAEESNSLEQIELNLSRKMDEINEKDNIQIYGDMLTLERMQVQDDAEAARGSTDPLVNSIEKFFRTHKLKIHLPSDGSTADIFGRALGQKDMQVELRGLVQGASEARTKLKKLMLPLIFALVAKKMIILPIIVTLIGIIGIKGLGAGLMSLLVSGAIALSAILTPPPPPRVSYGVVRPHEIHHDHWHRSQEEVNQPYRGWVPEYNGDQYPFQEIP